MLNRRTADGRRCHDRSCTGTAVTHTTDELVSCNNKHSHLSNTAERVVEVVKERMKKRAKKQTTPIPRIYHNGLQEVAQQDNRENVAPSLPTFSSMLSSL